MTYHPNPQSPLYWQYDGLPILAEVESHQFAVDTAKAQLAPGAVVLDVAAGNGALTKALADAGFKLACTSWNERVALPVPSYRIDLDKSFSIADVGGHPYDMACAIEIIEHVENPAQLLRSLASVLRPGGLLVLSTPNVESAAARLEWLLHGHPYTFNTDEVVRNRHISMMWRQGLEHLIALAGFDIAEKHGHGAVRHHGVLQRLLKAPVHRLMKALLPGELTGNSRTYLLRRTAAMPRSTGAGDVA